MTKQEIKVIVSNCITPRIICRIFFKYDKNYWYYFPLKANDKLFLGVAEDDFILNGYTIRRFRDITKAEIKNDICLDINIKEGIVDRIIVPDVDITSWETIFISLQKIGKNIIGLLNADCAITVLPESLTASMALFSGNRRTKLIIMNIIKQSARL